VTRHRDWPVALLLLLGLFGGLLLLAAGERLMCAAHDDRLRYCAAYQPTTEETP
jgi:hypothetical protein